MHIKSLITDYICHFNYFVIDKIKKWFKNIKYEIDSYLYMRWHTKSCNNARKKLNKIWSSRRNKRQYEKQTGKEPVNKYGKYTGDYKDWIEENKGE